jgi:hypothetical protein
MRMYIHRAGIAVHCHDGEDIMKVKPVRGKRKEGCWLVLVLDSIEPVA